MGTAQAAGRRACSPPPGRPAGRLAHAERGQGRRLRQRPRRQGAGQRDGHPGARGSTPRPSRPTPRTRSRSPSATSGAAAAEPLAGRRPGRRHGAPSVRRSPRWTGVANDRERAAGGRGVAGRRRRRGRRRRPGRPVHAGHARPPAGRGAGALATTLVVREDSLTLYGFADDDERSVFELLQTANGVGPRLAQAVLAIHPPRRAAPRRGHGRPARRSRRYPASARRAPSGWCSSCRTGSARGSARATARAGRRSGTPRGLARPVRARWSASGWSDQGGRRRRRPLAPVADEQSPTTGSGEVAGPAAGARQLLARSWSMSPRRSTGPRPTAGSTASARSGRCRRGRGRRGARRRVGAAPALAARLHRAAQGARQLDLVLEGAKRRGRTAGPRAALRPARPGQDQPRADHRRGAGHVGADHQRSGDRARGRPRRDAVLAGHGDVLFIDEIHRIARPAEEMLYMAMEDFRVDVVVGKGPGATAIPLEITPFTLVGATTRAGLLPAPLRDRFGFTGQMEFYEPPSWSVLRRSAAAARRRADDGRRPRRSPAGRAARRASPTGCCAGCATTPRCRRRAASRRGRAGRSGALRRRRAGLDRLDRAVLEALCPVRRWSGRAVDPRGRRRRGVEHRREGREPFLVRGAAGPHPAGPGRHTGGLAAPRPDPAAGFHRSRTPCPLDDGPDARRAARGPGGSPAEPRARCPGQPRWWVRNASPRLAPRPGASGPNHCLPRRGRPRHEGPTSLMFTGSGLGYLLDPAPPVRRSWCSSW